MDRRPLTIELRKEGPNLIRRYHLPVFGLIDGAVPEPQLLAENVRERRPDRCVHVVALAVYQELKHEASRK